jgi:hypothetical protein
MSESNPTSPARPTGITILAILAFIGGLFGLCGITIALLAMLGVSAGLAQALDMAGITVAGGILAVLLMASSILGVILYLAFAYGAWTLKPWAWMLGVIAEGWAILSVIFKLINGSKFGSQIIPLVIAAGILVYLFSPEVKKAFGRV